MKVSFTKASKKDGVNVVTVRPDNSVDITYGEIVYLGIKARWSDTIYTVKFKCNRQDGSTLKTTEWPKRFAKPSVGKPVEYNVVFIDFAP
jgi:hypothetical protein